MFHCLLLLLLWDDLRLTVIEAWDQIGLKVRASKSHLTFQASSWLWLLLAKLAMVALTELLANHGFSQDCQIWWQHPSKSMFIIIILMDFRIFQTCLLDNSWCRILKHMAASDPALQHTPPAVTSLVGNCLFSFSLQNYTSQKGKRKRYKAEVAN